MRPTRTQWIAPLIIMAITFALFLPAIHGGFVGWDDDQNFLNNPYYRGLGWTQIKWMFTNFFMGPYQPLCWLSFGLDYSLWGMNPHGYHFSNICLHALNAVLFYFVTIDLLQLGFPDLSETDRPPLVISSIFSALLFSVHPLRVESVAWVTERKDVLSGSFYLATLLCYLKACRWSRDGSSRKKFLSMAIFCYALSLLAKAMGMTLPFVLVILDIYPLRQLSGDPKQWSQPQYRRVWLEKFPFFLAALAAGTAAVVGQHQAGATQSLAQSGAAFRLELPFIGPVLYLAKTVFPFRLLPLYDVPSNLRLPLFPSLLNIGIVLGLTVMLICLRRRWPIGLAAWAYYIITLLPVMGIVPIGYQLAADRYTYLPCLSWSVLSAAGILHVYNRLALQGKAFLLAFLCGCIAGLSFLTWRQTKIWHDSVTLWNYDLSVNPGSAIAHDNLANAYNRLGVDLGKEGRSTEAISALRRALALQPGYAEARNNLSIAENNLGITLFQQNQITQAISAFEQSLALRPDYLEALNNLSSAYNSLGAISATRNHVQEAIEYFKQALRIRPNNAAANNNLQRALAIRSRRNENVLP